VEIFRLWKSFLKETHFLVKCRRVVRFYKLYCKQRAKARHSQETSLRTELESLQSELQQDPTCARTQALLQCYQASLTEMETVKVNGKLLRARIRWKEHGDSCRKEFFNAVKERHSNARITKFNTKQGGSTLDPSELLATYFDFYSQLYSAPP
jgi:hypothetical protein